MSDSPAKTFHSLLEEFDQAMLVTQNQDHQLRCRPMAIAKIESDSDVWFATSIESGKVDEIQSNPHVCVAMQDGSKFLSMSGTAKLVRDKSKIDELWNEAWKVWFPEGKDDPSLALLYVDATEGELWDQSGVKGIKYLLAAGKAYLAGTRPQTDDATHEKVKL